MTLTEEITELTEKWYRYANLDHHKDRDCHWYIEKRWSYGDEPYYQAFHHGYLIEDWSSTKCGTAELAETILRDKLKNEIASAILHLNDVIVDEETADWFGGKEKVLEILKELKK
jgi:hypothetical protein